MMLAPSATPMGGASLTPVAIATIGILAMLVLILLLVGVLLVRLMAAPDRRLDSVETSMGEVRTDLAGVERSVSEIKADLVGVKAVTLRIERVVNLIVDGALNERGTT